MCAVGLHMLLSSCFSVGLILLVENCVALLHRRNCCHVGPAAVTASLLLLQDFQRFSFNSEVLQLICMISRTKTDHNSQRNYTVLAGNYVTNDSKYFSKPCSPIFIHELKVADGEFCGIAGASGDVGVSCRAEGLHWRRGRRKMKQLPCRDQERCRMVIGERKLLAVTREASHPLTFKKSKRKSTTVLVSTDEA